MTDTITRTTRVEDLPELLRVPEAAAWLGVSAGVVYALAQSGALRSVKLGRLLRVPRTALLSMAKGKDSAA
jgi:excisionase family DNA binding protein